MAEYVEHTALVPCYHATSSLQIREQTRRVTFTESIFPDDFASQLSRTTVIPGQLAYQRVEGTSKQVFAEGLRKFHALCREDHRALAQYRSEKVRCA